jgi:hypothetical protein
MLILAGCKLNDKEESQKIESLSSELDRFFSLLRLQKAYDSNRFSDMITEITLKIRDADVSTYRGIFNEYIYAELNNANAISTITDSFNYIYFKEISNRDVSSRFVRYFFARIESFLAQGMGLKMKHSFDDLVSKTGPVNGFHIEHILADNDDNLAVFNNDEDTFYRERSRLGGLLLLKGRDNISSNDEPYKKKLKSYANTLYWNETLREDSYKSKLDFSDLIKKYKLKMRAIPDNFGPDELEERHKLLAQMVQIIWN